MPDKIVNKEPKPGTPAKKSVRMSEVAQARGDLPEYIKAEELVAFRPFTIFGATPSKGRFGDRVRFDVAYKDGGTTVKRVLTLSANDERNDLMYNVRRNGAIVGCRIVQLHLGGGQTYWKIVDNDAALPEDVHLVDAGTQMSIDEIPFE